MDSLRVIVRCVYWFVVVEKDNQKRVHRLALCAHAQRRSASSHTAVQKKRAVGR